MTHYFPNYHPDARNDAWHGKGWTEWELVKAATPRYPGHRQPIVPAWGYFDESDPQWAAREIDLAADHGVTCLLCDWYWYKDGPYLQHGLENGPSFSGQRSCGRCPHRATIAGSVGERPELFRTRTPTSHLEMG